MEKPQKKRRPAKKKALDDTPRKFVRMMEQMKQPRVKKPVVQSKPEIKIKSGESMSEFRQRVDQSIPLPKARGSDSRKEMRNAKKHKTKAENLRREYHDKWAKKQKQMESDSDLDVSDDGEDVWAKVNAKAKRPKFNEVADRPPELVKLKQFSSVPKSAGSLARREMLEQERQRFIEAYRKQNELRANAGKPEHETED